MRILQFSEQRAAIIVCILFWEGNCPFCTILELVSTHMAQNLGLGQHPFYFYMDLKQFCEEGLQLLNYLLSCLPKLNCKVAKDIPQLCAVAFCKHQYLMLQVRREVDKYDWPLKAAFKHGRPHYIITLALGFSFSTVMGSNLFQNYATVCSLVNWQVTHIFCFSCSK